MRFGVEHRARACVCLRDGPVEWGAKLRRSGSATLRRAEARRHAQYAAAGGRWTILSPSLNPRDLRFWASSSKVFACSKTVPARTTTQLSAYSARSPAETGGLAEGWKATDRNAGSPYRFGRWRIGTSSRIGVRRTTCEALTQRGQNVICIHGALCRSTRPHRSQVWITGSRHPPERRRSDSG